MGAAKSCCKRQTDDKLMVTKMDLSHCGCLEVPHIVFNAERCIETLILASNQITSLPPQLFHCQEMKHLNLNDNCLSAIPPAIGSLQHLISLKLDKNNLQELPENLKMCKKLRRLSLNNNPWKQMPNIVTQLISLDELYINDCELNYLPASVGRLAKLKIIELRNNNLCNLPLSMTRLEMLTRLDISDNEFNEFPTCISKLKALTELLLDNNDIEEIIDIRNLVHLEHLDASYNHITNVSETIGCCVHLNMLNLSFNYIEQLPNSIGNISHLQTLQLEMNELTEIPKSIGKLLQLEELNLCNNKLYSLPNTIGLLRNLRNLNVSRNIIEEFPPEIGSCTKLAIINAAYNRLQVLPSEIGYLNNLKVLDLVGNFLMYLPITIINLRGVRAIWLSANQNVPLIPFTEDLNLASGERFLTNIALPQLGEIPLRNSKSYDMKPANNEKTSSSWNKKIRFAEDENIIPGKLHRTPTPFPKELRSPSRKTRIGEPKASDNYANVVDGKVSEQEIPLLQPSVCVTKASSGIAFSDGCVTRIREANIRRNNKDTNSELGTPDCDNENEIILLEPGYALEKGTNEPTSFDKIVLKEPQATNSKSVSIEESYSKPENDQKISDKVPFSPPLQNRNVHDDNVVNDNLKYSKEQFTQLHPVDVEGNYQADSTANYEQPVIYSNLLNNDSRSDFAEGERSEGENIKINPQRIREMYHNDVIYESGQNVKDSGPHSAIDYYNANVEGQPKYQCSNSTTYRDNNFIRVPSLNSNHSDCRRTYSSSPPPQRHSANGNHERVDCRPPQLNSTLKSETPSKQDLISLAEQMKNRNISPPCYEIAKMYSTKAALFENNRMDQLKSN